MSERTYHDAENLRPEVPDLAKALVYVSYLRGIQEDWPAQEEINEDSLVDVYPFTKRYGGGVVSTKIEWADRVWNPVTGCSPVSRGCDNCYAARMAKRLAGRFGYAYSNPFAVLVRYERMGDPASLKKPQRIFVCSMGDLFHEEVPFDAIEDIYNEIGDNAQHAFMVLTKRPSRALDFTKRHRGVFAQPRNLWIGVSVEDQATADERIPILLNIPAAIRFVSCEPLLEAVDLSPFLAEAPGPRTTQEPMYAMRELLDWAICGAETGPGARPMDPAWARSIRDQCADADIPFFFKKMSGGAPIPKDLMIREFPK